MPEPQPPQRAESREITELRRLKRENPQLAQAADLQIDLLQLVRRVQTRVTLPTIRMDPAYLTERLANPPVLHFDHLPVDWSDLRFLLRGCAAAMRKHDSLDETDFRRVDALCRDAERLPPAVRSWYDAASPGAPPIIPEAEGLEPVLQQGMRPFLTRASEAVTARIDLSGWQRGRCPVCGGEPDFALITPAADRLLICGRCTARWRFDQLACPYCPDGDRSQTTSFASRDGQYRIFACEACKRYLKAFDSRRAPRPIIPSVDSIATLPLDAAAMQKGYT